MLGVWTKNMAPSVSSYGYRENSGWLRFLQAMSIGLKRWLPGAGGVLPCRAMVKTWVFLNQISSIHFDKSKNMAFTVAVLLYMAIVKTLKIFYEKNLDWFSNKFEEIFLGWPYNRILQAMFIGWKTWPPGLNKVWFWYSNFSINSSLVTYEFPQAIFFWQKTHQSIGLFRILSMELYSGPFVLADLM